MRSLCRLLTGRCRRLGRRVGRRGTALLFFAMLDLIYAFSLAVPPARARQNPTTRFVDGIAPLECWATLWLAVGLICLAGAFAYRDRWAFAAAMALKVLWGVTMLLGWALLGLERGYVAAIIWLAMAGWVFVISTWPEPTLPVLSGELEPEPTPPAAPAVEGGD